LIIKKPFLVIQEGLFVLLNSNQHAFIRPGTTVRHRHDDGDDARDRVGQNISLGELVSVQNESNGSNVMSFVK